MLTSLLDILLVLLPVLISVAYITLFERKVLASMQRRVGPDTVGIVGTLQPFSDALKLLVKEIIVPQGSQISLFVLAPSITLISALLGWAIIPYGYGLIISDLDLSWLYYLAVASVGVYGIIFGGWAGNSAYSLLGSIRSTAHLVSYELVLGAAAFAPLVLSNSFNFFQVTYVQSWIWFAIPLIPLFLIFLITGLAEINRTPFDLVEAESELVSGFMTEHSGWVFVFYFLAEYSNIALISSVTAVVWLGAYTFPILDQLSYASGIILGVKTLLLIFVVIWVRGTLPRLRFDQLMYTAWSVLLPVVFALLVVVLSIALLSPSLI